MSTNIKFRSDVQGLRAISVLAVILFHFNPAWLPGGFVGVDVFLVISGFLIGSILLYKKEQPSYTFAGTLNYFYSSRLKRIAPAYFSMLIFVTLISAVLFLPQDFTTYTKGLEEATYFNSNNYFATFGDYFAAANYEQPLLHTWSLAVELQFYLVAPVIFLILPKPMLKWLLPIAILGLTVYAEQQLRVQGNAQAIYYSFSARLPAFFMGAWVAILTSNDNMAKFVDSQKLWFAVLACVCISFAFIYPKVTGFFPGVAGLVPIAGTALMLWTNANHSIDWLLSSKIMVWVGEQSYSLYLWHWPVLALLRYYTGAEVLSFEFGLLFIFLTLSFSFASYYLIEQPLRAKNASVKTKLGYVLLLAGFGSMAYTMKPINDGLTPAPLPIEYTRYSDPATICHGQIVGDCLRGDLSSDKEVLVLGDSHAAMLNYFFDYLGKELGFKARIITASSCVTIPGFDYPRIAEWAQKPCLAQIEQAEKYLANSDVIFVASMWNWQLASRDFQSAIELFLATQSQAGSKIYLLEQVPLLSKNPLRALRFQTLGLRSKIDVDRAYRQANTSVQHLASSYSGVISLDFENTGLFAQAPFSDGILIYFDESHLNEEGVKRYAAAARSVFEKIMD